MEFEKNIIGCILLKPKLIEDICIPIEAFKSFEARISLKILFDQFSKYNTISLVGIPTTYKSFFKNNQEANLVVSFLGECMELECTAANFDYYQEQLLNFFVKDKILLLIRDYQESKITTEDLLELIHQYESMSFKKKNVLLSGSDIYKIIRKENKKIIFRFEKLSKYANIQEHDLVILSARPGIGKTAFALNLMEDLSNKYNCLYFNMEMSESQIFKRLVSINSGIDIKYLDEPSTLYQDDKIKEFCNAVAKKKIKVFTSSQTIKTIRSKIIRESVNEHLIVFIDYVGLIRNNQKNQSNYERVTDIVKELRQISLDYNCTIFLIAQINRNSDKTKDKRPQISDLKESGELEQSGTTVIMLHDTNIYNESDISNVQLIIGKNRNGSVGIINFDYKKSNQRFEEAKR